MAKPKAGKLTPSQINVWVADQKTKFGTVLDTISDDARADCLLYNGEQVDLWLKSNIFPGTYCQDKVREKLAEMLLELDICTAEGVFNIKQKVLQSRWTMKKDQCGAFANDLKVALTMDPGGDYVATTQHIVDMHKLRFTSMLEG